MEGKRMQTRFTNQHNARLTKVSHSRGCTSAFETIVEAWESFSLKIWLKEHEGSYHIGSWHQANRSLAKGNAINDRRIHFMTRSANDDAYAGLRRPVTDDVTSCYDSLSLSHLCSHKFNCPEKHRCWARTIYRHKRCGVNEKSAGITQRILLQLGILHSGSNNQNLRRDYNLDCRETVYFN